MISWTDPFLNISFFNPASGELETEAIYGERWLRWAYQTRLGRFAVASFLQRALFSQWYGWRMDRPNSTRLIRPFIERYGVDEREFAEEVDTYGSFNEFFYRCLKPQARPLDTAPDSVIYPADGRHLAIPEIGKATVFYAKGQAFDLPSFIGDTELAKRFEGGSLLISRLCPVDYHRFHFPVAGCAGVAQTLSGGLRSVSPIALRRSLSILWQNRRQRTLITQADGKAILVVEIGATCVGRIQQTYPVGEWVAKGAEKGYFAFGGSCVVTLFPAGAIKFNPSLIEYSAQGIETYARVGEMAGTLLTS